MKRLCDVAKPFRPRRPINLAREVKRRLRLPQQHVTAEGDTVVSSEVVVAPPGRGQCSSIQSRCSVASRCDSKYIQVKEQ